MKTLHNNAPEGKEFIGAERYYKCQIGVNIMCDVDCFSLH